VFAEVLGCIGVQRGAVKRLRARTPLWLVDHPTGRLVLRRDSVLRPTDASAVGSRVEWLHDLLRRLEQVGFPSPRPAPVFAERSCASIGGSVWEAVTYLPGRVVGWSRRPSLQELGAFLARFHDAVIGIDVPTQRPLSLPVEGLAGAAATVTGLVHPDARRLLVEPAAEVERGLDAIGHREAPRSAIHGDFTAHNVVAAGAPLAPVGVIDFANAYVEVTLADISFGLWRSGRPSQRADTFDPGRCTSFVRGYSSVRPLRTDHAAAIVVYLQARGVQIIVKQARRGVTDLGPVAKLRWLTENGGDLQRRVEHVLS